MIPIPIYIPIDSLSDAEIICPKWITAIACIGGLVAMVGLLWMLAALVLSIITDNRIDATEKPHSYSLVLMMLGLGMFVISTVLMLIFGQTVAE